MPDRVRVFANIWLLCTSADPLIIPKSALQHAAPDIIVRKFRFRIYRLNRKHQHDRHNGNLRRHPPDMHTAVHLHQWHRLLSRRIMFDLGQQNLHQRLQYRRHNMCDSSRLLNTTNDINY